LTRTKGEQILLQIAIFGMAEAWHGLRGGVSDCFDGHLATLSVWSDLSGIWMY
jgi:hypothetical protein